MAKLIDVVKDLNNHINSNELSTVLSSSDPMNVELSDDEHNAITGNIKGLMTLDRAINDPKVIDKISPSIEQKLKGKFKADALYFVEKELSGIGKTLGL